MFKGFWTKFVPTFKRDPEQGNNFPGFSPVLGQFDVKFTIDIRCRFPLDSFPMYFKSMEAASMIKFNCTAIWTFFGEFL